MDAFSPLLYDECVDLASLTPNQNYSVSWIPVINSNLLEVEIEMNGNASVCSSTQAITLTKGSSYDFDDIHTVLQITNVSVSGNGFSFILHAMADDDNNPLTVDNEVQISGYSCLRVLTPTPTVCYASDEMESIVALFNGQLANQSFSSSGSIPTALVPLIGNDLRMLIGTEINNWQYSNPSTNIHNVSISYGASNSDVISLQFNYNAGGSNGAFNFITSNYSILSVTPIYGAPADDFVFRFKCNAGGTITYSDAEGSIEVLVGSTNQNYNAGDCGDLPCDAAEQENREQLEHFLAILASNDELASTTGLSNAYYLGPRLLGILNLSDETGLVWAPVLSNTNKDLDASFEYNNAELGTVSLRFVNSNPAFTIDQISLLTNLYVDETTSIAGQYLHFTIWASDGTDYELLEGESIFALKNCTSCPAEGNLPYSEDFDDAKNSGSSGYISGSEVCTTRGYYTITDDAYELCNVSNVQALDRLNQGVGAFFLASALDDTQGAYNCETVSMWQSPSIPVNQFTEYEVSMWFKRASDDDINPQISINANGHAMITSSNISAFGSWEERKFIWYSAGSSTLSINVFLCSNSQSAAPLVALDDISVTKRGCKPVEYVVSTFPEIIPDDPCDNSLADYSLNIAGAAYENYIIHIKEEFANQMRLHCLQSANESLAMTYPDREYHYTLYYYDQAGNLRRTVPPAGIERIEDPQDLATVESDRDDNLQFGNRNVLTDHNLYTTYEYNSLNQVVKQTTPDAGITIFWYDQLGRLILSQNAKQLSSNQYSYTLYDNLGRITQVGQCVNSSAPTEAICRDDAQLATWRSGNSAYEQITRTWYDEAYFTSLPASFTQENLRGRVVSVAIDHDGDGNYESATHYTYDIHGNVYSLLQDIPALDAFDVQYTQTDYDYDLVSGKVLAVAYQDGQPDRFYHRYEYDADNRITHVYTSRDEVIWDEDAAYYYYGHGPLARTELGEIKVQGTDYAYTLQGWIKGVNSTILSSSNDMGHDGKLDDGATGNYISSMPNLHGHFPEDIASYSLNYYSESSNSFYDYTPIISGSSPWLAAEAYNSNGNLWNGNIQAMATSVYTDNGNGLEKSPMLYQYKYDQLQRIRQSNSYVATGLLSGNSWINKTAGGYDELYTYADGNGNLGSIARKAEGNSLDELEYSYYAGTNRLHFVTDNAATTAYAGDIEGTAGEFTYDAIGNLITDDSEGIDNIEWTVYGKIRAIDFNDQADMLFLYDAMGNRIAKVLDAGNGLTDISLCDVTWYARDAQGNIMATYEQEYNSEKSTLSLAELNIYGSSRLGVKNININLEDINYNSYFSNLIGMKQYELTNHLGNVLTTISDNKLAFDNGSDGYIDGYMANVLTSQDYYPFGMLQPNRNYSSNSYRYGFNGKENDNEVQGTGNQQDYGARVYDPRLGIFLSIDPLFRSYSFQSPYGAFNENPIIYNDPTGKGGVVTINGSTITIHTTIYVYPDENVTAQQMQQFKALLGIGPNETSLTYSDTYQGVRLPMYIKGADVQYSLFTINYVVDVIIITQDEAEQMQQTNDASVNYFMLQNGLIREKELNNMECAAGKTIINKEEGGQGQNIGLLSILGLQQEVSSVKYTILEEAWHTMAGRNYHGDEKEEQKDYSHNLPNRGRSICDGVTGGTNTILPSDWYALMRAADKKQPEQSNNEVKDASFTVGEDAGRLIQQTDY